MKIFELEAYDEQLVRQAIEKITTYIKNIDGKFKSEITIKVK